MSRERRGENKKKLTRSQRQALLLVGGLALAVVLVIGITVAVFFSNNRPQTEQPDSSLSGSANTDEIIEETDYDPNAFVLDATQYAQTILGVTEDAGEEYVRDTLFIGDSNTYRYMMYGMTTLSNDIGITGMGIQDVLTEKCVKFVGYSDFVTIPEAVSIMQPRRIIICFGTNNAGGSWSAEYMSQQYSLMLDGIEEAYPYADIIICAVPPIGRYHQNTSVTMTTIDAFNQALAALAQERGCAFLNTSEVLKDPQTGFAMDGYTIEDGIHMTQKAVDALEGYVRTHAWLSEDRRPTPLSPVPRRDETQPYVITDEHPYTGTVAGTGSASSSRPEGLEIVFTVNDAAMGGLEGEVEQIVPEGENCTTVKAAAKEGYTFAYWSCTVGRIDDVHDPELTFVSPAGFDVERVVVTANFVKSGYLITVKSSDANVGTAGIRGEGDTLLNEASIREGDEVKLYAFLKQGVSGYRFAGWQIRADGQDKILSDKLEFTYKPESSLEIVALFSPIEYDVTTSAQPAAGGSVAFQKGSGAVTFTATANADYVFDHWVINDQTIGDLGTKNPLNLQLDRDMSAVAVFRATQCTVTVAAGSGGSVAPAGAQKVAVGTQLTVTATPADGYEFDHWDVGGSNAGTSTQLTVTADADKTVTAVFRQKAVEPPPPPPDSSSSSETPPPVDSSSTSESTGEGSSSEAPPAESPSSDTSSGDSAPAGDPAAGDPAADGPGA